ncbi:MAG TPA: MCE family protein [Mycobacteriales bacterium]|nr:MCE family protein [Mycobacteriales bacterium]
MPAGVLIAAKRKLQGLAFLVVVGFLLALTIVIYNKALPWDHTIKVVLQADRIGHQLIVPADVKLRGIEVGQVRAVSTNGQYALLDLEIDPNEASIIPINVTAEILPKTLFGEKYVDLILPADPSATNISEVKNPVIDENHSTTAIETEKVFDDLLPLLQALKPVQLNYTLTALATALQGRGSELGQNLTLADQYFASFNPHLGTFEHDISGLADLAANYAQATPNLLAMARNFSVNARTITEKQDVYAQFLIGTAGFANTAREITAQNASNLINLADFSEPTLATLARYSPEFTCLLIGLDRIHPLIASTFQTLGASPGIPASTPALHITVQAIQQPPGYTYPVDLPQNSSDPGPDCHGLPNAPAPPGIAPPPPNSSKVALASMGLDGSPADVSAVAAVTAPLLGVSSDQVPNYADLLVGPVVRGGAVSYS